MSKLKFFFEQNNKIILECYEDSQTPFHIAIQSKQLKTLDWLYPNAFWLFANCEKASPLHLAAELGDLGIGSYK